MWTLYSIWDNTLTENPAWLRPKMVIQKLKDIFQDE